MPTYEYKCQSCQKVFEVRQRFSDEPLQTHEECGGPVERLISPPAFQFKGSGWYITDYAKSGSGRSGAGGGASNGESKTEGKKESKTEGKSSSSDSSSSSSSTASSPSSSNSGRD